jgi:hypothetical protein
MKTTDLVFHRPSKKISLPKNNGDLVLSASFPENRLEQFMCEDKLRPQSYRLRGTDCSFY